VLLLLPSSLLAPAMGDRTEDEMATDYINSLMYAVPDVALMVPKSRPVKTCGHMSPNRARGALPLSRASSCAAAREPVRWCWRRLPMQRP
jgi:hypothetical protein